MSNKRGPGFHHVAVRTSDLAASIRFYEEGLGFKRSFGWGEGDGEIVLMDIGDGNYVELFAGGKAPDGQPLRSPVEHFAFRVEDAQASYDRAIAAGAASQIEPKIVPLKGDHVVTVKIAFVKGPDGEVIEFFENDEL